MAIAFDTEMLLFTEERYRIGFIMCLDRGV